MGSLAAIGVDNDFAASQSCVAMRTADDELARRIDIDLDAWDLADVVGRVDIVVVRTEEVEHLLAAYLLLHARDENMDDVVLDAGKHGIVFIKFVVLGADNDGVDTLWNAFVAVFHRHLTLCIGAQIGHHLSFFADIRQRAHQQVSQMQRNGHIILSLVHRIAEHHALVTSTLVDRLS